MKMIFFGLMAFTLSASAQNLVLNPDFENVITSTCGIDGELESSLEDWQNPTSATPLVYFTTNDASCYNHQPFSTYPGPIGLKGSQTPRSGNVMVGLVTYTIPGLNQRQYVQVELTESLVIGQDYIVSFYTSLADSISNGSTGIGAYLSADAPTLASDGVLEFEAQVVAEDIIMETENWVLVSDTITASEALNYITIGHFKNDDDTGLLSNPTSSGAVGTYGAYYYIDDISVELFVDASEIHENVPEATFMTAVLNENWLNIAFTTLPMHPSIQLYNMTGQLVYSNGEVADSNCKINMESFAPGVYILKAESNGVVQTVKVLR